MLTKTARRIADKMILQDVIPEEDRELYEYGMVQGVIMIINWITAILIGFLFGLYWQAAVFLILFTPIRIYAGGYHAGSQFQCYIYTSLLQFAVMAAIKYVSFSIWISLGIILLSAYCMFFIAPVEAENKPMTKEEAKKYGFISRRNWFLEVLMFAAAYFLQWDMLCRCIILVFALMSMLLLLGKWTTPKKGQDEEQVGEQLAD
jgi:accessory gene regulator B